MLFKRLMLCPVVKLNYKENLSSLKSQFMQPFAVIVCLMHLQNEAGTFIIKTLTLSGDCR